MNLHKPTHGGYPGEVPKHPRWLGERCDECGDRMYQEENPTGGDSWYYRCFRGHEKWIGK